MCCPGCSAVATLIRDTGLDAFYRQRSAYNEKPQEDLLQQQEYAIYDDAELAANFSTVDEAGNCTAALLIGGITCAACTWLIEQTLQKCPGVARAQVNLSQQKLAITFDPNILPLSAIFNTLADLGYRPLPFQESSRRQQVQREYRQDLRRLAVAGLGMMQVGMFAIALHAGDIQGMEPHFVALLRWVSLPVAAFVVIYCARPFFESAWRHLRHGALVMDLPVALAIGLAFLASTWATLTGTGQVYFDSVVMFTFFLLLGRFVEKRARGRDSFDWSDVERRLPAAVTVKRQDGWHSVPRIRLAVGDTVLVRAGDIIPVDGEVLAGSSAVQEDAFTGEPLPRLIAPNDRVYAGTLNLQSNIELLAASDFRDTRLAALARLVETASVEKPRLAAFADRMASRFVAFVLLVAASTALFWLFHAPGQALWVSLSVLVISCPCALALATPAALSTATNALQRRGILARGENALESLGNCTHLLLDKTGTLTRGELAIEHIQLLSDRSEAVVLALCTALQQHSNHPMAKAFSGDAIAGTTPAALTDITCRVGAGMEGTDGNHLYRMGSHSYCAEFASALQSPPDDDLLWIALVEDATALAWIGLTDSLRPEAADLVRQSQAAGLRVELLTGDSSARGPRLARQLGMDAEHHGQTPEQKLAYVRELQACGARVVMVGDGINDGPVLGGADTSFAVAGASDLARARADFILLDGNLCKVVETLNKARRCQRIIRQNFGWALLYNVGAIPLAAAGLVPPWVAAIGMSLSSLLVVGNSLRLSNR